MPASRAAVGRQRLDDLWMHCPSGARLPAFLPAAIRSVLIRSAAEAIEPGRVYAQIEKSKRTAFMHMPPEA
jgi:hypothetical protein